MYRTDDYNEDQLPGIVTAVAALALALEENGGLRSQSYADTLRRLRDLMPEDQADGESGAIIEKILGAIADAGVARTAPHDRQGGTVLKVA